jgi:hypothetical protein
MGAGRTITLVGGTPTQSRKKIQSTYFIYNEDSNSVKIGKAQDPIVRLRALQTGSVSKLRLLAVIPNDVEKEQHRRWSYLRINPNQEWFTGSPSLLEFIRKIKKGKS